MRHVCVLNSSPNSNVIVMKLVLGLLTLLISAPGAEASHHRQSGHKSESEVAQMTPERRIQEYLAELRGHGYGDDYERLLSEFLMHDGLVVVPYLVGVIDQYDPAHDKGSGKERYLACYAAEGLLSAIDENTVRLRGTAQGIKGIDAIKRLAERMVAANYNTADGEEYRRYKSALIPLEHLEGTSWFDVAIKDTIELRKNIRLSSNELLSLINYIIARDAQYPSWSKTERYKDWSKTNEAGNPLQYTIVSNIEPFYRMYQDYKAHAR